MRNTLFFKAMGIGVVLFILHAALGFYLTGRLNEIYTREAAIRSEAQAVSLASFVNWMAVHGKLKPEEAHLALKEFIADYPGNPNGVLTLRSATGKVQAVSRNGAALGLDKLDKQDTGRIFLLRPESEALRESGYRFSDLSSIRAGWAGGTLHTPMASGEEQSYVGIGKMLFSKGYLMVQEASRLSPALEKDYTAAMTYGIAGIMAIYLISLCLCLYLLSGAVREPAAAPKPVDLYRFFGMGLVGMAMLGLVLMQRTGIGPAKIVRYFDVSDVVSVGIIVVMALLCLYMAFLLQKKPSVSQAGPQFRL